MYKSRSDSENIISHTAGQFEAEFEKIKKRILKDGDMPDCKASEMYEHLENLAQFNLGKFIISNKGLDGKWTQYVVLHPQNGRLTGSNDEGRPFTKLERWILDRAPVVLATQERFFNFQKILQSCMRNKIAFASVPCGAMDELLGLNFSGITNFSLTGIDLDADSIEYAKQNSKQNNLAGHCTFIREDAWNLSSANQFDVITSNGLNIYESDTNRVIQLYSNIKKSLKKDGKFISSFLTPAPGSEKESPWDMHQINQEDLKLQKVIFTYILNIRWQDSYRTEKQETAMLHAAGFKTVRVIYDRQCIFPTFIAEC